MTTQTPRERPVAAVRQPHGGLVQFSDLFLMELSNWRWSWRGVVTTGMIAPMFSMIAIGLFARDGGAAATAYVLTGNVVLALMFTTMSRMASRFSFMRHVGTLAFYASLPIQRLILIVAVAAAFFLIALPAVLFTIAFGAYFLALPLHLHPLLLLILPLCTLSLAGVGALIGTALRTMDEVNSVSQVLTFMLLALGPVLIPPERLPAFMYWLGYASPATYAASALRQTLLIPPTARLLVDIAVLIGFALVTFWFTSRKMDWRQG